MLKTSSVWTVQNLELNLVVRTADDGQLYFQTPKRIALELLQWFKFHYFEVWRETGAKGNPFDPIDLRGADSSKQMERVNCWMHIMELEESLGQTGQKFGNGAKFQIIPASNLTQH